jgi:hypothetical protein
VVWNVVKSIAPPETDFSKLPPPEVLGLAYFEQRQQRINAAQEQSALMLQQYQSTLARSSSTNSMDPSTDSAYLEGQQSSPNTQ